MVSIPLPELLPKADIVFAANNTSSSLEAALQADLKRRQNSIKEKDREELAYLNEIFSTKDAFIGLTNVGKRGIKYEGK